MVRLLEASVEELRLDRQAVEAQMEDKILERMKAQDQDLEGEVRSKKRKMDRLNCAYENLVGQFEDRVTNYPKEEDQTEPTISRSRVIAILKEEHVEVIERGLGE